MVMNEDLPREEQVRIIAKNYDRKSTECEVLRQENDKLKKENEVLQKTIEQKDILYKNMITTFKEKKDAGTEAYRQLQEERELFSQRLKAREKELNKARGMVVVARDSLCKAHKKLDEFCVALKYKSVPLPQAEEVKEENPAPEEVSAEEKKKAAFIEYIRQLISFYKATDSLTGISIMARKLKVTHLTKEQFFKFGFNQDQEKITDEYILDVYSKIK